eukprot:TRINITY_DN39909_c0_g1_i1.p1 TRINITY_DN39909_c0_g1~~TRINITY_DN39909_c0_g1_i1.p1  ORF type:complete len:702 (-),score=98.44 TRINITY_DN39909_c0_g1_i1:52-2082(-)
MDEAHWSVPPWLLRFYRRTRQRCVALVARIAGDEGVQEEQDTALRDRAGRDSVRSRGDSVLAPGEKLYEVVYPGGTILRSGEDVMSPPVATLRPRDRVIVYEERGRRVAVQTRKGLHGWLSLCTSEDVPILRLVAQRPLDSRREQLSETEREAKWAGIRVDAGGREAQPLSVRASGPGVPVNLWRPPPDLGVPKPKPQPSRPQPVPKLEAPPGIVRGALSAREPMREDLLGMGDGNKQHSQRVRFVTDGEDLLDFSAPSVFDTDPGPRATQQAVPSLIAALRGATSEGRSHGASSTARGSSSSARTSSSAVDLAAAFTRQAPLASAGSAKGGVAQIPEAPPSRGPSVVADKEFDNINAFTYLDIIDVEPTTAQSSTPDAKGTVDNNVDEAVSDSGSDDPGQDVIISDVAEGKERETADPRQIGTRDRGELIACMNEDVKEQTTEDPFKGVAMWAAATMQPPSRQGKAAPKSAVPANPAADLDVSRNPEEVLKANHVAGDFALDASTRTQASLPSEFPPVPASPPKVSEVPIAAEEADVEILEPVDMESLPLPELFPTRALLTAHGDQIKADAADGQSGNEEWPFEAEADGALPDTAEALAWNPPPRIVSEVVSDSDAEDGDVSAGATSEPGTSEKDGKQLLAAARAERQGSTDAEDSLDVGSATDMDRESLHGALL